MKVREAVAEFLTREDVEILIGYPVNDVIELLDNHSTETSVSRYPRGSS